MVSLLKKFVLRILGVYVALEVTALLLLALLVNTESYSNLNAMEKARILSLVTWFEDRYEFHPYLNYSQKNIDESVRLKAIKNSEKNIFHLAIQGGSFAMYFSDYLETEGAKKSLDLLAQELGYKSIQVINMAA